jgi:hypothetical protein
MATNLTPQQMAELQRLFSTPTGSGDGNAYMPNTVDYGGQSWKQDNGGGYAATGPLYGDNQYKYTNYDTGGAQTAEGDARMSDWSPEKDFLMAVAGLVGGGLMMGGTAGFGFGAGAGGAGGAAGAGEMVNGAFLGEAPWSATGGGALDFGAGTSAMGAGAGGGGGALGTMAPLEQMALPAGMSASAMPTEMALAGGSSLLGKALGVGSSLLGAAAGAQGQNASQTTSKDLPEYMKPYITGDGGLLAQVQQQLAASRSPERMAMNNQIRSNAMSLLNAPIAGNPTTGWTFGR